MIFICREHECCVAEILIKTAKMLGQPASQNIVQLCELRNFLMTGNLSQLKFITLKQIKPTPKSSSQRPYRMGAGIYYRCV